MLLPIVRTELLLILVVVLIVALWASAGIGIGGLVRLIATRGSPPSKPTRHAAFWTVALSPFAGAALTFSKTYFAEEYRSDGMRVKCEGHPSVELEVWDDWAYREEIA